MGFRPVGGARQVSGQGLEVAAYFICGEADQCRSDTDHGGSRIEKGAHIIGTADAAAADDRAVRDCGYVAYALQAYR